MDIGSTMRAARVAAGISLAQMAKLTNFSKPYLGQVETGQRTASSRLISAYEDALGTRVGTSTGQVTMTDVDLLANLTDTVAKIGLRHGGVAAAEMAGAQWAWAERLLDGPMSDKVRTALHSQAALLVDRLAWSLKDVGRPNRAIKFHQKSVDLASRDAHVLAVVKINFASYIIDHGQPANALELDTIRGQLPVVSFTSHEARAEAFARLGRRQDSIREIGLADQAHADVDMSTLPATHAPYASGHAAHAHRAAGTALHILARQGDHRAVPLAIDRLTNAITNFGPDRARTIAKCEALIADLA